MKCETKMHGIDLIQFERDRQIELGRDAAHDLQWDADQLAVAAAVYAAPFEVYRYEGNHYRKAWTWPIDWDHRGKHSRLKQLVIAGAWCAAEIDRRLAKEMRKKSSRWERFLGAWFMYRFSFRLGRIRSLWYAFRLSGK
jgi:hypothetical protein